MIILAIGDVVGSGGCDFLRARLPALKKAEHADLVIANGENSADGNGITPFSADHLFASGVDVITTGNHVFRRREVYNLLDDNPRILRPANYPAGAPGHGFCVVDTGRARLCVANLIGTVFIDSFENPFLAADSILRQMEPGVATVFDFHAEATSEKRSLAFYLDGRAAAVFGTHTHVQTADEEIMPGGTAYLTDLGMCGPAHSVLGVEPSLAIRHYQTKMPVRFINAGAPYVLTGAVIEIRPESGTAVSIRRLRIL